MEYYLKTILIIFIIYLHYILYIHHLRILSLIHLIIERNIDTIIIKIPINIPL